MDAVSEEFRDLFEKETFAHFTTLMPDGSPHAVPVRIDADGDELLVTTVRGTRKERNVRRDGRVALSKVAREMYPAYAPALRRTRQREHRSALRASNRRSRRVTASDLPGPG